MTLRLPYIEHTRAGPPAYKPKKPRALSLFTLPKVIECNPALFVESRRGLSGSEPLLMAVARSRSTTGVGGGSGDYLTPGQGLTHARQPSPRGTRASPGHHVSKAGAHGGGGEAGALPLRRLSLPPVQPIGIPRPQRQSLLQAGFPALNATPSLPTKDCSASWWSRGADPRKNTSALHTQEESTPTNLEIAVKNTVIHVATREKKPTKKVNNPPKKSSSPRRGLLLPVPSATSIKPSSTTVTQPKPELNQRPTRRKHTRKPAPPGKNESTKDTSQAISDKRCRDPSVTAKETSPRAASLGPRVLAWELCPCVAPDPVVAPTPPVYTGRRPRITPQEAKREMSLRAIQKGLNSQRWESIVRAVRALLAGSREGWAAGGAGGAKVLWPRALRKMQALMGSPRRCVAMAAFTVVIDILRAKPSLIARPGGDKMVQQIFNHIARVNFGTFHRAIEAREEIINFKDVKKTIRLLMKITASSHSTAVREAAAECAVLVARRRGAELRSSGGAERLLRELGRRLARDPHGAVQRAGQQLLARMRRA